jgi:uncharacterized protein involved in type VI secretion and phage assembly
MSQQYAGPRETSLEAGGFVKGVALALVADNHDPDGLARIKVSYPWHSQPTESYWARIAVPMAGNGRGAVFLPEVGDEVLVVFEREDMRFPFVLGGLWNGKDKPPESNSNGRNDIRVIKTRKGHSLLFDDSEGNGRVELQLADGKRLAIDDSGLKLDDGSGNVLTIDTRGGAMSLKAGQRISLQAPSISLEATGSLSLKANASVEVKGMPVSIN